MVGDSYPSLRKQKEDALENLLLIEERKAEYVLITDIPLDLIRQERALRQTLQEIEQRLHTLLEVESPYRGLQPFRTEAHAAYYFGREQLTKELIDVVARKHIVAVVGRSGSGKSSLVFGGLLQQLRENRLPGSAKWRIATCQPGIDPVGALGLAIQEQLEPDTPNRIEQIARARALTSRLLKPAEDGGIRVANDIVPALKNQYPDSKHLLLVIDQFEEVLTAPIDGVAQADYIQLLLDLAATQWVKIVLTLRTDYYDALFRNPQLVQEAEQFNVHPMTQDELHSAIVKPAAATGRRFEEGLVSRILDDIADSPGDLALLEFTLTRLWEFQTADGLFTHAAYAEIGEVSGAIAKHADDVIKMLDEAQRQNARRLFLRLVRFQPSGANLDTAVRISVPLSDLSTDSRSLAVDTLAYERLVVTGRSVFGQEATPAGQNQLPVDQATVELVHDALIRHWQQFKTWLHEDAAWLVVRQELTAQVELWQRYGEEPSLLYAGKRLKAALRVQKERADEISERESRFLKISQQRQQVRSLTLRGGYALAALALLTIAWLIWRPAAPTYTDTEVPMPADQFNLAVAQFLVLSDATGNITELERHAAAATDDITSFLVDNGETLEEQFQMDVGILTPDRVQVRKAAQGDSEMLTVTVPELGRDMTVDELRANVFVYGYLQQGRGKQWTLEPHFNLSSSQSTLDWASELLGGYALGEPIAFTPSSFTAERVRIRTAMQARLMTLMLVIRGLDASEPGTQDGYEQAEQIFCPVLEDPELLQKYESVDLIYLFCGHALSNLLDLQQGSPQQPEDATLAERVIAAYAHGLEVNPNNLRLRASLASQYVRRSTPNPACTTGNLNELETAKAILASILQDANSGDFLPVPTRMEVNFMLGAVYFWTGHCDTTLDSGAKGIAFEQAAQYMDEVLAIQAATASSLGDTVNFTAAKAHSYLGYVYYLLYYSYGNNEDYLQFAAESYDTALVQFDTFLPDSAAYNYVDQIMPNALMAFCLSGQQQKAQDSLDWFVDVSNAAPHDTRDSVLARLTLTDQQRKECGL